MTMTDSFAWAKGYGSIMTNSKVPTFTHHCQHARLSCVELVCIQVPSFDIAVVAIASACFLRESGLVSVCEVQD
jgi:hypothetical protein